MIPVAQRLGIADLEILLVDVSKQMKRVDAGVSSMKSALVQVPKADWGGKAGQSKSVFNSLL